MTLQKWLVYLLVVPSELALSFKPELFKIIILALTMDFLFAKETDFTVLIYEYLSGETLFYLALGKESKILFPLQHFRVFHRIIESFGLEGAFKGHLVQLLCNEQGHLQLDKIAQSPIQPVLKCSLTA